MRFSNITKTGLFIAMLFASVPIFSQTSCDSTFVIISNFEILKSVLDKPDANITIETTAKLMCAFEAELRKTKKGRLLLNSTSGNAGYKNLKALRARYVMYKSALARMELE